MFISSAEIGAQYGNFNNAGATYQNLITIWHSNWYIPKQRNNPPTASTPKPQTSQAKITVFHEDNTEEY